MFNLMSLFGGGGGMTNPGLAPQTAGLLDGGPGPVNSYAGGGVGVPLTPGTNLLAAGGGSGGGAGPWYSSPTSLAGLGGFLGMLGGNMAPRDSWQHNLGNAVYQQAQAQIQNKQTQALINSIIANQMGQQQTGQQQGQQQPQPTQGMGGIFNGQNMGIGSLPAMNPFMSALGSVGSSLGSLFGTGSTTGLRGLQQTRY